MSFKDLPDCLLLEKCHNDDQQAYNILFQRYFKSLYGYALKYTKDNALSEELAIDVMFRLWQKRIDISWDINLSAYLFRSIKNALISHWRKKELQTVTLVDEEITQEARPADYDLQRQDLEKLYHQTVDTLSPQCKLVFKMSREEEMTYQQIAEAMNISVNTVKEHMSVALKGIRLLLISAD